MTAATVRAASEVSADHPAHPPADTWVAAVHASESDFAPLGGAVVIDESRVLTCAHVVASDGVVRDELWVAFPKAGSCPRRRVAAAAVVSAPPVKDLAVLTLQEPVSGGVDAARLRCPRPGDLVGQSWWAFGFPGQDPVGNSASGLVGESLTYGWVRLDTSSRYLVEPGFSGGALWSPDYEAVVGLVGQAHGNGDGRAITLHQADLDFPDLKLGALANWSAVAAGEVALTQWGWTLARDPEGVRHWRPRARGVSIESERGWRFRGRTAALNWIVAWLDRAPPDRRVLVVTGSPGVGKSAVLGRIVTTADPAIRLSLPPDDEAVRASLGSVSCAVHAKGKTALEVAEEIARAASAALPSEPDDLAPAIRDALTRRSEPQFNVVIDALDEAANPAQARAVIDHIVLPLAETCADAGARVIVGTRRRDDGGDLLGRFGAALAVIDLDDPGYFAEEDLAAYSLACLQLAGDERPDSPYIDHALAGRLAARIAAMSGKNFLIAGLIARSHGLHDETAANPDQLQFTATVDSALAAYLDRLSPVAGLPASHALTALAFAEAPGLPVTLWQLAVEAIYGTRISVEDLTWFARSAAANFLVEAGRDTTSDLQGGDAVPVYRLFHQALNDALLHRRADFAPRASDERALTRAFMTLGQLSEWQDAPQYLLRSLTGHAQAGKLVDDLLADDAYLLHADLRRLMHTAEDAASASGRRRARLLHLTPQAITALPGERAALFSLTEALDDLGTAYRAGRWEAAFRAKWAAVRPRNERAVLEGHQGAVNTVCPVTVNGQQLLASGDNDGTVRIWDPATGQQHAALKGHRDRVYAVCAVTVNGQELLASGGDDGPVRIWDPATGQQRAALEGHRGWVRAVCAVTVNGQELLASGGDDGTVRIWDPATGQQRAALIAHHGAVNAVCAVTVNGQELLASGGDDGTVRIWDPATGQQRAALKGHRDRVNAVCAVTVNGQELLATGDDDGTVRIWDPVTGQHRAAVVEGHWDRVNAVCAVTVNGQQLLATGSNDRKVRIWDPATGQQRTAVEGHRGTVTAVCVVTVNGQQLLATGSNDRTVRIWDPATGQQRTAVEGHRGTVTAVCAVTVNGQQLLATGSNDRTVRIWDPATGQQRTALEGHEGGVSAVCAVTVNGQQLLATGSNDRTVRIWDPATGHKRTVLKGHKGWVRAVCAVTVNGQELLASGDDDRRVRIWDPATGHKRTVLKGHKGWVRAVCAVTVNGQELLASGDDDRRVRIWDPATGHKRTVLKGHQGTVTAACVVTVNGQQLLATGSNDRTVRIWDPATGHQRAALEGHEGGVSAVCAVTVNGQQLLASGSHDHTVRIWDPQTATCLLTLPTYHAVFAVGWVAESLAVGLDTGILVIKLNSVS